jgi:hypothetical protein
MKILSTLVCVDMKDENCKYMPFENKEILGALINNNFPFFAYISLRRAYKQQLN